MYPNIYRTGSTTFLGLKFNRNDVDDSPISAPLVPQRPTSSMLKNLHFEFRKKNQYNFDFSLWDKHNDFPKLHFFGF